MSNSRMSIEIGLGALFILLSSVILLYIGFTEERSLDRTETHQEAEAIETGAGLYATNCARCHGENGEGLIGPPLNDEHFFTERIDEVGWGGTLRDYVISTVSSGRPVSTRPEQWPGEGTGYAMPSWSQDYGGPLRNDQIRDIADFVLNWESVAVGDAQVEIVSLPPPISADPAARGRALFNQQGCAACHTIQGVSSGQVGPDLTNIATVAGTRVGDMEAEAYIRQSILEPNAHMVEGFDPDVMPQDFGDKLSDEQLNDLVTFLLEQE